MTDEELIKQKIKETKHQSKQESKGNIGIIYGLILAVIQVLSTLLIPKEIPYFGLKLIGYIITTSFVIIQTTLHLIVFFSKNGDTLAKTGVTYIYASPVILIAFCFYRQLGFWSIAYGVICLIANGMVASGGNEALQKTFDEFFNLQDLSRKAVGMKIKKVFIVSIILSLLGTIGSYYMYLGFSHIERDVILSSVIILIGFFGIIDFIVFLTLKFISWRAEKILNKTFNLKMGDVTKNNQYETYSNIHIIYNYAVMFYRTISILLAFITLLIFSKFDVSSFVLITVAYIFCNGVLVYDNGYKDKTTYTAPKRNRITASTFNWTNNWSTTTYRDENGNETKVDHWKWN